MKPTDSVRRRSQSAETGLKSEDNSDLIPLRTGTNHLSNVKPLGLKTAVTCRDSGFQPAGSDRRSKAAAE